MNVGASSDERISYFGRGPSFAALLGISVRTVSCSEQPRRGCAGGGSRTVYCTPRKEVNAQGRLRFSREVRVRTDVRPGFLTISLPWCRPHHDPITNALMRGFIGRPLGELTRIGKLEGDVT